MQTAPNLQQTMPRASQHVQQGEFPQAEALLAPFLTAAPDANVLHLMGMIRIRLQRLEEAVEFLSRAHAADPRQHKIALNLGKTLAGLGRRDEAITAFRAAVALRPDLIEAYSELGRSLHEAGQFEDAEEAYRVMLHLSPGHGPAKLSLGAALMDGGRPDQAELPLRQGLTENHEPGLKSALHCNLALALRKQNKQAEALKHYDRAQAHDPVQPYLDLQRAELLQEMKRHDEAADIYVNLLAREPLNADIHRAYNDLLYRIGRTDEYLKSFDRAPQTAEPAVGVRPRS